MGRPYTLMSFVEGERLSDLLLGRDRQTVGACAYAAGQTLAALHAVTFPHPGFFGPDLTPQPQGDTEGEEWRDYIAQCLTEHGRTWLGTERTEKPWQFVLAHQAEVATFPAQAVLVHADYNGKNILMQTTPEGWQVAAVLDWEFAFAGSPLFDIGNFLRHEGDLPPDYAQEFERGYSAAGGALPPNWRRLARLLDLLNLCEFLNTPHSRPGIVAEMIRLIDALLSI
jgi:aminoglycoside phosphotransferase (APT) family kinase protein